MVKISYFSFHKKTSDDVNSLLETLPQLWKELVLLKLASKSFFAPWVSAHSLPNFMAIVQFLIKYILQGI